MPAWRVPSSYSVGEDLLVLTLDELVVVALQLGSLLRHR